MGVILHAGAALKATGAEAVFAKKATGVTKQTALL
jgi:hypothetical protein